MTIAVTAASGKLGSEIIRAVARLGSHSVVALARTPSKAEFLGVEVRSGDYDSRVALEKSLRGVKTVLLVSGMDEPARRVEQHRNVIRAAEDAGVRKIVYTSVQGAEAGTAFSPIVQSNRQTEQDVQDSRLDWAIGRNGIYIEPDVEFIDAYKKAGCIANCAGDRKCGYTTRPELAYAYARMLTEETHNGQTYNLHGEALTQAQLASYLNRAFHTNLSYREMTVAAYEQERVAALGEFLGRVIAGIYAGIREGGMDNPSHFSHAAGREHQRWADYFADVGTAAGQDLLH
ncbi:MAG: NAD(P)-dependent oxidoreductase [Gemmatimonadota bacterium]|nr:MAG: NAD(P)-dependent oxidoreductase [Gemmatimonadota bacterium]